MKLSLCLPALGAAGAAALLLAPREAVGFTLIGDSLPQSQRDVRVFDNFQDASANDNSTADPMFPGYVGAELAFWKGAIEWGSELHGDGSGDPHQPTGLGSGGANFDPSWQGNATGIGNSDQNIASALNANGGGVLAFAEGGLFNSGWRIRFYENHQWGDGPGTGLGGGTFDIQGIGAHEYGHALGLGHTFSGPTMQPGTSAPGTGQRSIEADDVAGVQAIYGVKAAAKPRILQYDVSGSTLTITGQAFSANGNEVWFTQAGAGGNGQPVKVTNVTSSAGGTQIVVNVPGAAGPGDVLVRKNGSGFDDLSNAFPFDPSGPIPGLAPPSIVSISPSTIDAVDPDGANTVTLSGQHFSSATDVQVAGASVDPLEWSVVDDATLTLDVPIVPALGAVDVTVVNALGADTIQLSVLANDPPVVGVPQFTSTLTGIDVTMGGTPGDVYFLFLSTDLVPSSVPGIVDLGIGNGLASLFLVQTLALPGGGGSLLNLPFAGVPFLTSIHFQGGVFDVSSGSLPLVETNVSTTTTL